VLFVVDATAIVSVPRLVGNPDEVFEGLSDAVADSDLCYCNEVLDELARIARDTDALNWARTNSVNRCHNGAGLNALEWVGHDFGEIVDVTTRDTQEPASQYVIAQALELRENKHEITVVTEDIREKPTRASLREACEHFRLPWINCLELLDELGLLEDEN
jgi:hypothetical protein